MILNTIFRLNLIFLDLHRLQLNYCKYQQLKYDLILIFQSLLLMILNTILQLNLIFLDFHIFLLNYCMFQQPKYDLILILHFKFLIILNAYLRLNLIFLNPQIFKQIKILCIEKFNSFIKKLNS